MPDTTTDPFKARQIALYQHVQYGYFTIWDVALAPASHVRVSEIVTLDFSKTSSAEAIQEALQTIDKLEQQARNELNAKLSQLNDRRASLLALTHETQS